MRTSKVAVYTAPCLATVMGLAYMYGDPSRTMSSSFNAAKAVAPMHTWGLMFMAGAVALMVAILLNHMVILAVTMWAGGLMYVWWAACFALQAVRDPNSSLVAWALYAIIALLHFVVSQRAWMSR